MINVPDNTIKTDTSDLCLPFIKLKDLSEKDLKRRREHIRDRLLDEERIRKDKELKKQRKLKEKEENFKFLNDEKNYVWDRELVRLPPIVCPNYNCHFPITKPYLSLFDTSSYQFPLYNKEIKRKDLLLRFNSPATMAEVERDFHQIDDCGVYRKQLEAQIRSKHKQLEENRNHEHQLDELMMKSYPFGDRRQENYSDRFHRLRAPLEQGVLDEKFFPWCALDFGKSNRRKAVSNKNVEPIVCKTKASYVTMG